MDKILSILKSNLEVAQHRMRMQANKHRTEREFSVRDFVFYGPYEIVERIGTVAYKLKLPEGTKIHLVFHVSCLKKHLGNLVQPLTELPDVSDEGMSHSVPQAVLARRIYKKGQAVGVQLLIHWLDDVAEKATWEYYDEFKSRFPDFKLEP
ncbi:uncharacterized protein [Malus domestica]|uniref:uncharacterized protein n=1 Tax=Malus domestica TaxID=3750 RepID=UPI0039754637